MSDPIQGQGAVRGHVDENNSLICRVVATDSMDTLDPHATDQEHSDFKCLLGDDPHGIMYQLELKDSFTQEHPHLSDGNTIVSIEGGRAIWNASSTQPAKIEYPQEAHIQVVSSKRRRLEAFRDRAHGTKSVIIVRVSFLDGNVTMNTTTMSSRVFGIGNDAPRRTVKSQFAECSFGKLNLVPAEGPGIVNGTVELKVPRNINGMHRDLLENLLMTEAQTQLGDIQDRYDHIMFAVPWGSKRGGYSTKWHAYSVIGGQLTFYNDKNIGYYSMPMHELGHNFGLYHSGQGPFQYGDMTGLMGSSTRAVGSFIDGRCFNSHKNWLLGWYSDRAITVDVSKGPWGGNVVAVIHYDKATDDDFVVIQVGDLYLHFNRRNLFNYGTLEFGDRVTIVRGTAPDEPSSLIGAIATTISTTSTVFRVRNFQNTGHDLIVEACEQVFGSRQSPELPDYMRLSIHLDDGTQTSTCDDQLTSTPSASPSVAPTGDLVSVRQLTPGPSTSTIPTRVAAAAPSISPTKILSDSPTNSPTQTSSLTPTLAPSFDNRKDTCEDSKTEKFLLNGRHGYRSCSWLARSPRWQEHICVPGHPAFDLCEELCGKCTDSCHDSTITFYVNRRQRMKSCEWLKKRPKWQQRLCTEKHAAYYLCQDTCDSCDR
jgi:hypothetical protein